MQAVPAQDERHVANPACVRAVAERVRPDLEARQWIHGAGQLAQTRQSVKIPAVLKDAGAVADDDMIFDIGPKSAQELVDIIMKAGTVVWNGPVGVFEFDQFGAGTKTIAMAIANTKAFTLAGGGDTIAAIQKYDIYDKISYISTAGGAFLEFLEGKKLPAVAILEERAK